MSPMLWRKSGGIRRKRKFSAPSATKSKTFQKTFLTSISAGVEIFIEAEIQGTKQEMLSFCSIRNAPLKMGYVSLQKGAEIPIPPSAEIHSLLLTNFSGVENSDEIHRVARPRNGKEWGVTIRFERAGEAPPRIASYTLEYPLGNVVYSEFPRTTAEGGFDLLTAGPNGLFDYDDDMEIEDVVLVEGEVMLEVTEMDIEGAGLFVRARAT